MLWFKAMFCLNQENDTANETIYVNADKIANSQLIKFPTNVSWHIFWKNFKQVLEPFE